MSFEYTHTDEDGDFLTIVVGPRGPLVSAHEQFQGKTTKSSVHYTPEDAPAVALAILEAAGIDSGDGQTGTQYTRVATYYLGLHKQELAEAQEREAEDAKVREFRAHQWKAQDENRAETMPPWEDMGNHNRDLWRVEYRAARKFFEETR